MKRNILTIIILAVGLINLTLMALITFAYLPYVKRVDALVKNVTSALHLELENPDAQEVNYRLEDLETVTIMTESTVNLLRAAEDKENHYARVTGSISVNTEHEDYKDKSPLVEKNLAQMEVFISDEINRYSADEVIANKAAIEQAVLERIQEYFDSKFIVMVSIKIVVT